MVVSDSSPSFTLSDLFKPLAAIAIVIVVVLLTQSIFGSLSWFKLIGTRGKIQLETLNVGVYWDQQCTNPVEYLDWGITEPGSVSNITIVIRNEGNTYATLFLNTTNWNPTNALDYITLNWDYNGQTLAPSQMATVTLYLMLATNTQETSQFTFDIIIGANQPT